MRREEILRFHLAARRTTTLAVQLLRGEGGTGITALEVDNQAAIRITGAFKPQRGHHLGFTIAFER